MQEIIEETKEIAYKKMQKLDFSVYDDYNDTFTVITRKMNLQCQTFSQHEIAGFNDELDLSSCLGKLAIFAVIMEKYYPSHKLRFGEVRNDWFRNRMLEILKESPRMKYDTSFMQEILLYEEPHGILFINDKQFEPLSYYMNEQIIHPGVQEFSLWEAISSSRLVSRANLTRNLAQRLSILEEAEHICPETSLVAENMVGAYIDADRYNDAIAKALWCHAKRPGARTLLVLYYLTESDVYLEELNEIYTDQMIYILKGEIDEKLRELES